MYVHGTGVGSYTRLCVVDCMSYAVVLGSYCMQFPCNNCTIILDVVSCALVACNTLQ